MPVYLYSCATCGRRYDIVKSIAQLDRVESCQNCGASMNRQVTAPAVRGDYAGYNCPVTGAWIEGRRAHEENLKKHGCRVLEPGETQRAVAAAKRNDEEFFERVAETAAAEVAALPADKLERLQSEISHGLDVQVERRSPT